MAQLMHSTLRREQEEPALEEGVPTSIPTKPVCVWGPQGRARGHNHLSRSCMPSLPPLLPPLPPSLDIMSKRWLILAMRESELSVHGSGP